MACIVRKLHDSTQTANSLFTGAYKHRSHVDSMQFNARAPATVRIQIALL